MPRIIAETRVGAVLKQFREDQVMKMADLVLDVTPVESIRKGREEKMLSELDPSMNAIEVQWPLRRRPFGIGIVNNDGPVRKRLYFFASSEQDVLDRLAVAEVLLL